MFQLKNSLSRAFAFREEALLSLRAAVQVSYFSRSILATECCRDFQGKTLDRRFNAKVSISQRAKNIVCKYSISVLRTGVQQDQGRTR